MATAKETVDYIIHKLGDNNFSYRPMFGEYALYCNSKVIGLVCDDVLFVKIIPASNELEKLCDKSTPYPGAKLYYVIEESQLSTIKNLSVILNAIADDLPAKKKK